MEETLQAPHASGLSQGEQAIKEGDASKNSGLQAIAQTHENLGHVGMKAEVTAAGEVMTPRDKQEELQHRQVHGQPSSQYTR